MQSRFIHYWLFFYLIISVIVASLVAKPAQAAEKFSPKPSILVFGDSLSAAYGMQASQGWVTLLQQRLELNQKDLKYKDLNHKDSNHKESNQKSLQKYNYHVVNASISGETTSGGLSRFATAISTHKPNIVILELGGNDGLRGLSASDTYNNLDAIMKLAKPAKIVLLGMKIPPNYGLKYSKEFSENYEKLAKKHQANLVPFFLENVAGKRELIQDDGLHPNVAAQAILLENVWKILEKILSKNTK